jgi:anti-anti-sigma regulatory factor
VIRLTTDNSNGSRVLIDGQLSGPAVEELRKYCAGRRKTGIILDLSGVVFADRSAAALLKELSAAGVAIEGCSDFIKELLR